MRKQVSTRSGCWFGFGIRRSSRTKIQHHATELADDRRVAAVAANAVAAIVAVLSTVGGGFAAAAVLLSC